MEKKQQQKKKCKKYENGSLVKMLVDRWSRDVIDLHNQIVIIFRIYRISIFHFKNINYNGHCESPVLNVQFGQQLVANSFACIFHPFHRRRHLNTIYVYMHENKKKNCKERRLGGEKNASRFTSFFLIYFKTRRVRKILHRYEKKKKPSIYNRKNNLQFAFQKWKKKNCKIL